MEDYQEPLLQPKSVADQHQVRHSARTNGKLHGEKETLAELQVSYPQLFKVGPGDGCCALLKGVTAINWPSKCQCISSEMLGLRAWLQTMSQQGKMAWPLLLNLVATYSVNVSMCAETGLQLLKILEYTLTQSVAILFPKSSIVCFNAGHFHSICWAPWEAGGYQVWSWNAVPALPNCADKAQACPSHAYWFCHDLAANELERRWHPLPTCRSWLHRL
jgi:hypothetical protein